MENQPRSDTSRVEEFGIRLRALEAVVYSSPEPSRLLEKDKALDTPAIRELRLREQLLVNELERVADLKLRLEKQLTDNIDAGDIDAVIKQRQELRDLEDEVRRELFAVQEKLFGLLRASNDG
jgi:hypothetical protein